MTENGYILFAEISSQGGMSCSIWLILLLVEEPLPVFKLTWIDLLVGGDTISINDGLEATSELVDLVVGWGLL